MNITCNKCGKRYVIADERIVGKTAPKVRCKQCQNLISINLPNEVNGANSAPDRVAENTQSVSRTVKDAQDSASSSAESPDIWHAMIAGKQAGPFPLSQILELIRSGEVTARSYLWNPSLPNWQRANEIGAVQSFFAPSPPSEPPQRSTQTPRQPPEAQAAETPEPALHSRIPATEKTPAYRAKEKDVDASAEPASEDPFAQFGPVDEKDLPPPGEATKFFIAQAGVNKRNPPWKIALFALGFIGAPIALVYVLNTFEIVRLPTVTRTTDDGEEVQESFFSAGGMSGLRDLLTGSKAQKTVKGEGKKSVGSGGMASSNRRPETKADDPGSAGEAKANREGFLKDLYDDDESLGKTAPKSIAQASPQVESKEGLSREAASKVVSDHMKAFNGCIEAARKRNPNLAMKSFVVTLTIGPSGTVKSTIIDPKTHESTDWGQCIIRSGRRIVFPPSDGDTVLEVPVKQSATIQL